MNLLFIPVCVVRALPNDFQQFLRRQNLNFRMLKINIYNLFFCTFCLYTIIKVFKLAVSRTFITSSCVIPTTCNSPHIYLKATVIIISYKVDQSKTFIFAAKNRTKKPLCGDFLCIPKWVKIIS